MNSDRTLGMNHQQPHPHRLFQLPLLFVLVLLLAACGGGAVGTPTPIPADVVRPEQPTPAYSTLQPEFRLEQPEQSPIFMATVAPLATPKPNADMLRAELLKAMLMNLPPSAMGVATGGATIYAEPGGNVVGSLPAGGSLTVTGRSTDGNWLAIYTNDALTGWVRAGSLRLFGADDLETVTEALSPAPVATMLAEAMIPPALSVADVIATRAAAPTSAPDTQPSPAPDPAAQAEPSPSSSGEPMALIGTVETEGNLNLRETPSAEGALVASLAGGSPVIVLARTADSAWLQVRTPLGDGWVDARFIAAEGDVSALPLDEE